MSDNLGAIATRGVFWTGAGQIVRQVIQVVGSIVLARLLAPDDFGLLGMAMFFIGIGQLFADFGIGSAIVQSRADDRVVLSSCFWLNLGVAAGLVLLILALSPLIADFYRRADLVPVVALLSMNLMLAGLQVVPHAVLYRDMRFRTLASAQIAGSLAGAVIAIAMAWAGNGVWALVAQPLIGSATALAVAAVAAHWLPRMEFSWVKVAPLARFSFPLLGTGLVGYANRNADSLLVGRFLGAGALGIYSMAIQIMLYPLQQVSSVFVRVLFPTLVKIREDVPRLQAAYLRAVGCIALITFPMMGGLFAVAPDFVEVVFGASWSEMAPVLKVLAWVGLMQSVGTTVGTIYLSTGNNALAFRVTLIASPLLIGGMAAGIPWGIFGVAVGYAVTSYAVFYYSLTQAFRLIDLNVRAMFTAVARPFAATIAMVAIVLGVYWVVEGLPALTRLIVTVATGIGAYGAFSYWFNRAQLREISELLFSLRTSRSA